MIKHFCDCCGIQLDGEEWVRIEYKITNVNDTSMFTHESRKKYSDLCPECFKDCAKILDGGNNGTKNDNNI